MDLGFNILISLEFGILLRSVKTPNITEITKST